MKKENIATAIQVIVVGLMTVCTFFLQSIYTDFKELSKQVNKHETDIAVIKNQIANIKN